MKNIEILYDITTIVIQVPKQDQRAFHLLLETRYLHFISPLDWYQMRNLSLSESAIYMYKCDFKYWNKQ